MKHQIEGKTGFRHLQKFLYEHQVSGRGHREELGQTLNDAQ
jgi:hypothetical protein